MTNDNAISTAYDELQAIVDGDLNDGDEPPHARRYVCVQRSHAGEVVLK